MLDPSLIRIVYFWKVFFEIIKIKLISGLVLL